MAGVIEHFRDTDTGRHLAKLAVIEDPAAYGADGQLEFGDAIRKLRSKIREQRFSELQLKASTASLTQDEKEEFARLLQNGEAGEDRKE